MSEKLPEKVIFKLITEGGTEIIQSEYGVDSSGGNVGDVCCGGGDDGDDGDALDVVIVVMG